MTVNATRYLFSFGGTGGAPIATSFANQEVAFYSSSIINGISVGNQNYGTATGRQQTISFDDTPVVVLHQLIAANASVSPFSGLVMPMIGRLRSGGGFGSGSTLSAS